MAGHNSADLKLNSLVSQALTQKETMIKVLEEQLALERKRREEVTASFKQQLAEFESERDALEDIRKAANAMERRQADRATNGSASKRGDTDLDMVPSREVTQTS